MFLVEKIKPYYKYRGCSCLLVVLVGKKYLIYLSIVSRDVTLEEKKERHSHISSYCRLKLDHKTVSTVLLKLG